MTFLSIFKSEVWKLLRKNISKGQLTGYIAANIVGLSIILTGFLFFQDSRTNNNQSDTFFSEDYVVLSKRVEGVGFASTYFTDEDIAKLQQQPWVKKLGRFSSSQFAVNGSINMGGKSLATYLFFESVPDEFFDKLPSQWYFNPEDKFVPIILSRDYLTLYNFGFAMPQGLPQVSEEIIGMVPITLTITGKQQTTEQFEAAIVGFSSRLNTIAVPQEFMDWANKRYNDSVATEAPKTTRLIVKTDKFDGEEMKQYLQKEEIEISGNTNDAGNISAFLSVVSGVVTSNGVVISLLALFILLLSIFLLLQKSRQTLRNLMLLGYSPKEIGRHYEVLVTMANVGITIVAIIATLVSRTLWTSKLYEIGLGGASLWPTLTIALTYLLLVSGINIYIIRRKMIDIWNNR